MKWWKYLRPRNPYTRALVPWICFTGLSALFLGQLFHLAFLPSVFLGLNIGAFMLYGFDKASAGAHRERVPEVILWLSALLGGSLGAVTGMQLFRHKTKKTSFQFVLAILVLLQIGLIIWYLNASGILTPYSSHGTPSLPNIP